MIDRRTFLEIGGAAALGGPAWIRAVAAPIAISRAGLIFLTIEVNGTSTKALIDTGAVRGVQLSSALAERLGLALAQTGRTAQRYDGAHALLGARLASLAFAGTRRSDVEASVSPGDIEKISSQIGEPFDAILGWPLLGERSFLIDYAAGALEIGTAPSPVGLALPLEPGRSLPVTAGTLSGEATTFLIDTGAPNCNVDASLAGGAALDSRVELPFEIGGKAFTTAFRVRDLAPMTRGVGARAVIGHRFLQGYRFAWDKEARTIRLV